MAVSKKEEFTIEDAWLADVAKALSHPARIKILKILTEMSVCMCGDIVELLPLSQSTVSQHLKELKRVGLIKGEIEGPKVCYCVNNETLQKAKQELDLLFSQVCNCKIKRKKNYGTVEKEKPGSNCKRKSERATAEKKVLL